jgi:hypothetical protein
MILYFLNSKTGSKPRALANIFANALWSLVVNTVIHEVGKFPFYKLLHAPTAQATHRTAINHMTYNLPAPPMPAPETSANIGLAAIGVERSMLVHQNKYVR